MSKKSENKRTLKEWRVHYGYSQEEVANIIGVRTATISNWENNPKKIQVEYAEIFADLYNTSLNGIIFLPNIRTRNTK